MIKELPTHHLCSVLLVPVLWVWISNVSLSWLTCYPSLMFCEAAPHPLIILMVTGSPVVNQLQPLPWEVHSELRDQTGKRDHRIPCVTCWPQLLKDRGSGSSREGTWPLAPVSCHMFFFSVSQRKWCQSKLPLVSSGLDCILWPNLHFGLFLRKQIPKNPSLRGLSSALSGGV